MAVNEEAYERAKEIIHNSLNIDDYYKEIVNDKIELSAQTLVPCVLHDERTASFKYFKDTNTFSCFGCGKGGSVVELHYHLVKRDDDSYTKVKAILDLSREFNIKIPNLFKSIQRNSKEFKKEVESYKKVGPVKGDNNSYTSTYMYNKIEEKLKVLKNKDIELYINICNRVDIISMIGEDEVEQLEKILSEIG